MTEQTAEITTVIQNIILSISAVATVIIAYSGLSTWRKELKGRSEYQLAKDLLETVYEVRDKFKHVRNPAIYSFELKFPRFCGHRVKGVNWKRPKGEVDEESSQEIQSGI